MTSCERRRDTHRDSWSMKDGEGDTDERVTMPHIETCENYAKDSQEAEVF